MTGFARSEGGENGYRWTWEVKSVNSRNLDLRFRLPPGYDDLEAHGRGEAPKRFARGNFSVHLNLQRPERSQAVRVNEDVLSQMLELVDGLKRRTTASPIQLENLLSLPGVLEPMAEEDEPEETRNKRVAALIASFEDALTRLAAARAEEGTRLRAIMEERLAEIETQYASAESCAGARPADFDGEPEPITQEQLEELLGGDKPVSEDRLAQEIAVLATRGDVREELDRLVAHIASARELIGDGGAIGRRLDFLCQEFNREANTLCSKSSDMELTRIGLDLKAAIERLREQVQNVE